MGPVNVEHTEPQTSILGFDLHFGTESGWKWMFIQRIRQEEQR